jgi:HEAT repeat protein
MRVISEVVQGKVAAADAEIQEILEAGMRDADPSVRRTAVGTVASILQLAAMPDVPEAQAWGPRLRPVAEALLERLEEAARDPEFGVRMEAWRGLVGPAAIAARKDPLPLPIVEKLAALYDSDQHPSLRAFAVQSLRTSQQSPDPAVRKIALRILLTALSESDPYVVQAAGWNAFESKAPEALPLLIAQLKNPSHIARMGAAVGIQGYAALALDYLPQMEAALEKEPPGPTRSTLEAAIKRVREGRVP